MDMVTEEKYLGDIISNDRKHTKTYYPEDPRDLESLMKSLEYSTAWYLVHVIFGLQEYLEKQCLYQSFYST